MLVSKVRSASALPIVKDNVMGRGIWGFGRVALGAWSDYHGCSKVGVVVGLCGEMEEKLCYMHGKGLVLLD